jgi:hypothetical protein
MVLAVRNPKDKRLDKLFLKIKMEKNLSIKWMR